MSEKRSIAFAIVAGSLASIAILALPKCSPKADGEKRVLSTADKPQPGFHIG